MAQTRFERLEKKYLVTGRQLEELMPVILQHMAVDQYGRHTISNIYYDTPDFALVRKSIQKPQYKEKLRLRAYGRPGEEDPVFVEMKKKVGGVVYKRRAEMPLSQAKAFLAGTGTAQGQVAREIEWFLRSNHVAPRVALSYDRVALAGKDDAALRLTVDTNIRWRDTELELTKGAAGAPLLERGQALIEVKLPGAMPLWMARLFSRCGVLPTSFSKYGTCYTQHLSAREGQGGTQSA
ncbi:MAG: polyphosphate polymerase domain-containing protein [Eubacteriales bacterium]|nr:polyphosphate polymerase domain-containing protein [Eubacteriales bacterium]